MTRLTEALERAQLLPVPKSSSGSAPASTEEVLSRWHFDAGPSAAPSPAVPTAPAALPKPLDDRPAEFGGALPRDLANKLIVGADVDPGLVEEYRRLSALLHNVQMTRRVRSVMVASAVAAEGKTLTATNVALTLSHSFERRVLLVDADLRRPSIHTMFQLPNAHGLVDSLINVDSHRLPVQTVSRNLCVLPAGRPTSDPMSLLVSESMKQLLADAAAQFDWVIVDTPPVALMPDAKLLASMVDTALLVVSANTTPYPLVQRAAAAIGAGRILGVVFNRADRGALSDGYYAYAHGYGYRQPAAGGAAASGKRFRVFGRADARK